MGRKILTVEALVPDRDFIEVVREGKTYKIEIREEGELSLPDIGRVVKSAKQLGLALAGDAGVETMVDADSFADGVLKIILVESSELPLAELLSVLRPMQKFEVVRAFTQVGVARRAGKAPTVEGSPAPKLTGDESSPGSAGTTEVN